MKPNLAAIKEYYKKEGEYLSRVADLDVVTEARDKVRADFEVSVSCVIVVGLFFI
jgi:hypothetical protein